MYENKIVVAVKGLIMHNGKMLIIKRQKQDYGGNTWEAVGGKLEFGEDFIQALIREAKEEVGLDITVNKLLYATTFKTHYNRQIVIITYLCECHNTNVSLSYEHTEFKWANKAEILALFPQTIIDDFIKHDVFFKIKLK